MTVHQPWAEGQTNPPSMEKSFSQHFTQYPTSPIQMRSATKYKGEATVVFSKAEADKLAAPLRLVLVGKFSHNRSALEEIR